MCSCKCKPILASVILTHNIHDAFCIRLRAPKQASSKQQQAQFSSSLLPFHGSGWTARGLSWAIYFKQSVWPAALALALLYLTVLSLGLLMTAYLKWQGMTEAVLSLYRGAGAVSGLLATVAFPPIHKVAGNVSVGAIDIASSAFVSQIVS